MRQEALFMQQPPNPEPVTEARLRRIGKRLGIYRLPLVANTRLAVVRNSALAYSRAAADGLYPEPCKEVMKFAADVSNVK